MAALIRSFPEALVAFLYRDPTEVLVSLETLPSEWMASRRVEPRHLVDGVDHRAMSSGDFGAWMIGRFLAMAASHVAGQGILLSYTDLPEAMWDRLCPHLALTVSDDLRAAMVGASRNDAKNPDPTPFHADSAAKQTQATASQRDAVTRYATGHYQVLERWPKA